jgi:hypothetical protein
MTSQRKTIIIIDLHSITNKMHVQRNEPIVSGAEMVKITTSEVIVPTQQPEETIQQPCYEPQASPKAQQTPLDPIAEGSQLTRKERQEKINKSDFRSKMSLSFIRRCGRVFTALEENEDDDEPDFSMFKSDIPEAM